MARVYEFGRIGERRIGLKAWKDGQMKRAVELLFPSAREGDLESQNAIGRILMSGVDDVPRDLVAAVKWLTLASRGGSTAAKEVVPALLEQASKDEAAEGRRQAFEAQQYILNWENGKPTDVIPIDPQRVKSMDAETAAHAGANFHDGLSGPVDYVSSFICYLHAAELGHRIVQYNVGIALKAGKGAMPDSDAAYRWFKLSADQGWDQSLLMIGIMHFSGEGAPKNKALALEYLAAAEAAGNTSAPQIAEMIKKGGKFVPT